MVLWPRSIRNNSFQSCSAPCSSGGGFGHHQKTKVGSVQNRLDSKRAPTPAPFGSKKSNRLGEVQVLTLRGPKPAPKNESLFCSKPVGIKKGSDPDPLLEAKKSNRLGEVQVLTLRGPKPAPKNESRFCSKPVGVKKGSGPDPPSEAKKSNRLPNFWLLKNQELLITTG